MLHCSILSACGKVRVILKCCIRRVSVSERCELRRKKNVAMHKYWLDKVILGCLLFLGNTSSYNAESFQIRREVKLKYS
jgi:hypothetical protein